MDTGHDLAYNFFRGAQLFSELRDIETEVEFQKHRILAITPKRLEIINRTHLQSCLSCCMTVAKPMTHAACCM